MIIYNGNERIEISMEEYAKKIRYNTRRVASTH